MTPANVDDREGLKLVLNTFDLDAPLVKKLFLDGGYAGGPFEAWAKTTTGIEVEVVRRPDEGITVVGGIAQLPTNTPTEEQFRLAVEMARRKGVQGGSETLGGGADVCVAADLQTVESGLRGAYADLRRLYLCGWELYFAE